MLRKQQDQKVYRIVCRRRVGERNFMMGGLICAQDWIDTHANLKNRWIGSVFRSDSEKGEPGLRIDKGPALPG